MAEFYLKASFAFQCSNAELALLNEAFQAATDISIGFDPGQPSAAFLAVFPPFEHADPWSGLRSIFPDPQFPTFGADISADTTSEAPDVWAVHIFGMDDFQPEPISNLIHHCCQATLGAGPIGFAWAETCSKPRVNEFGGGWCAIFRDRIEFETSREALATALAEGIL
jgi:hypothetical protein